ncbi:peroxisomal targeting signal 1 receptor-like [Macrobrachium nipponense]|uniref:peroxisomal targeting signal 1 receptor-like n=1 Tax=Macrobrachium nipponense TaxID=159736 RepID=UPI0030C88F26
MTETQAAAAAAPQAFRMDSLLQEMREIESMRARAGPLRGPGIADLASEAGTWAEEYLASETHVQEIGPGSDWTKEFVEHQNGLTSPDIITDNDTRWAHEYLNENFLDDASSTEASKWVEEYNPQEDSELAKTANELLGTVDDPKFHNTEFMKFIKKLGEGSKGDVSKDWTNEFLSSNTSKENNLEESWSTEFTQGQKQQLHEQWQKEFTVCYRHGVVSLTLRKNLVQLAQQVVRSLPVEAKGMADTSGKGKIHSEKFCPAQDEHQKSLSAE